MFVLRTGIGWSRLLRDLLGVSGATCWRRLREWTEAGVWPGLHQVLLAELRAAGAPDLDRRAALGVVMDEAEAGQAAVNPWPGEVRSVVVVPQDRSGLVDVVDTVLAGARLSWRRARQERLLHSPAG